MGGVGCYPQCHVYDVKYVFYESRVSYTWQYCSSASIWKTEQTLWYGTLGPINHDIDVAELPSYFRKECKTVVITKIKTQWDKHMHNIETYSV